MPCLRIRLLSLRDVRPNHHSASAGPPQRLDGDLKECDAFGRRHEVFELVTSPSSGDHLGYPLREPGRADIAFGTRIDALLQEGPADL